MLSRQSNSVITVSSDARIAAAPGGAPHRRHRFIGWTGVVAPRRRAEGLCTWADRQVGRVLAALERAGLTETRRVIYISDLKTGRYKYNYYDGYPPELFDLAADPPEERNLAADAKHAHLVAGFEKQLRAMLDPEATHARAKADQAALIARFGGPESLQCRSPRSLRRHAALQAQPGSDPSC